MSIFDTQDTCCTPTELSLAGPDNRPGLAQIRYRLGTHPRFKQAMLRALNAAPALTGLSSRDDADASIALIDGWATVLDVLGFYQERIANEGFLLPAGERRSVLELARAIGYELNPGVAAETFLAFTVEQVPGAETEIRIDSGLKVQSIPGQDEKPQTFETVEQLAALPELNELRPRLAAPHSFLRATTRVYVEGVGTRLEPGDLVLLVGRSRENRPLSERWDVRTLIEVETDAKNNRTILRWAHELGHADPWVEPAESPKLYAFRVRASLFGFNAPDWRLMSENIKQEFDPDGNQRTQWPDFRIQTVAERRIDLDAVYESILTDSWILLDKPGYRELYRAERVFTDSRTDYSLTAKTTSMILDANRHLTWFPLRDTSVFAASEILPLADDPIELPVFGDRIELNEAYPQLQAGRRVIFHGLPARQVVVSDRSRIYRSGDEVRTGSLPPLQLIPDDGGSALDLAEGDLLEIASAPETLANGDIAWRLVTDGGIAGTVIADADDLLVVSDAERDASTFAPRHTQAEVAEVNTIRAIEGDEQHSVLVLETALQFTYQRQSLRINANVAAATHGETRAEIIAELTGGARSETIGSGNSAIGMQSFTLTQTPLTYTQAATASGGESSLEIRVDGIAWSEVPSLYDQPGDARVYATRQNDQHKTTVMFGDGIHGARLPTGRDNIAATYRIGTGMEGQVRRDQLQLLMDRPLGIKDVTNPLCAEGAQDPEDLDAARANAPLTVLTLDRIVSAQDFEDFARAFAGIGKAQAAVLWNGERQIVHLTVGGADGRPVDPAATLLGNLRSAIDLARHPDQEIRIDSYIEQRFSLSLALVIAATHGRETVVDAVRELLTDSYRFETRAFAQSVTASEIAALVQAVDGVEAVILKHLDGRHPLQYPTLTAAPAHWDNDQTSIVPAVLLLLDPDALGLEVQVS
ncbi:MAG: putative baseplate assembly protein [Gammaproteobacteria bacterium]|nr:MAG: putative baseplate assembly protein [Gammaproteobacteria bacterium]